MTNEETEVLVIGAGPVGLSTALFLADKGIRVLVADKRDPLGAPPRASTSLRTLELFRSIGLGPALDRITWDGPAPLRSVFRESATGALLHRAEPPARYADRLDTCSPIGARRVTTQRELQRLALAELRRRGGQVRFDVELTDFTEDDETVHAQLGEHRIRTRYLVGADGAHSGVRDRLGIGMPGRQVADRLDTAFFRADLRRVLPESATHACFIRNDDVYCTLFEKSADGQYWTSHILSYPGKPAELTRLPPDKTLRLLRSAIGDDTVSIDLLECNPWEVTLGIASAFRKGRVFLAGDAAHVQSSAGGLGMNTGIQDGHNLAWKLAAVLRGQAGESLLDSYETERRAAVEASLALSHGMYRGYRDRQDTNELYARMAADYLRGMMFYSYGDEPDVLDDRAKPGCRLPHRWLTETVSTLDLVGTEWTLLTGPKGTGWLDAGVRTRQIVEDMAPDAFAEMAGTEADGALLVRPDGFVAWRSPGLPADPRDAVRSALRTALGT